MSRPIDEIKEELQRTLQEITTSVRECNSQIDTYEDLKEDFLRHKARVRNLIGTCEGER